MDLYAWKCSRCDRMGGENVRLVEVVTVVRVLHEATAGSLTFPTQGEETVTERWVECPDCGSRWLVPEGVAVHFRDDTE